MDNLQYLPDNIKAIILASLHFKTLYYIFKNFKFTQLYKKVLLNITQEKKFEIIGYSYESDDFDIRKITKNTIPPLTPCILESIDEREIFLSLVDKDIVDLNYYIDDQYLLNRYIHGHHSDNLGEINQIPLWIYYILYFGDIGYFSCNPKEVYKSVFSSFKRTKKLPVSKIWLNEEERTLSEIWWMLRKIENKNQHDPKLYIEFPGKQFEKAVQKYFPNIPGIL